MSNDRFHWTARSRAMGVALFALGLAAAAGIAPAQTPSAPVQTEKAGPPAPAATPDSVGGVTVNGARRSPDQANIPADKRDEYDAAVARQAEFQAYRESTPPLTADAKGVGDPNDLSKDYPGLHSQLPAQADRP